ELSGAGRDERLRHLLLVQVVADRELWLGPEPTDGREDVVLLDEPPGEQRRLRGVVPVVVVLPDDLAAEDAAPLLRVLGLRRPAGVDVGEVRLHPERDRRVGRSRPGERERAADGDRLRRYAGCRRRGAAERAGHGERKRGYQPYRAHDELSHRLPP